MRSNTVKVTVTMEAVNPLVLTATRPRIAADGSDATSFKVMYEGEDVTGGGEEDKESRDRRVSRIEQFLLQRRPEGRGVRGGIRGSYFGTHQRRFWGFLQKCSVLPFHCYVVWPLYLFLVGPKCSTEQNPDRLVQVAIHQNDEYTSNNYYDFASYFKFSGIPAIFFDFDKEGPSAVSMSAADVVNTIKEYQATGAKVGIAMSSTVDAPATSRLR